MSAEPATREVPAGEVPANEAPVVDEHPADEPESPSSRPPLRRLAPIAAVLAVLALGFFGYGLWQDSKVVEVEDAHLSAPQIPLPSRAGGTLKRVYVSVGDQVAPHRPIARVGNEVITSDVPGTVMGVRNDVGASIPAGSIVVWLMDWKDLRVVGLIEEDAGLDEIAPGKRAWVKVDTFGGRKFYGTVEDISVRPARRDIRFSISGKREERQYEVKVRLDGEPDAALRQGMSARIWVEK